MRLMEGNCNWRDYSDYGVMMASWPCLLGIHSG